jgi:SAM-dependent methyltransferase
MNDNCQVEWEASYARGENFVFYPNEYVIRFTAKYLRKQVGLREFRDQAQNFRSPLPVLDLGCGIGRHVIFAHQMGMLPSGIDLSQNAVNLARRWAKEVGGETLAERIIQGDVRNLPWPDGAFDAAVSHGVLDSMPALVAQEAVVELSRVLAPQGYCYVDLISGDDSNHGREFSGDVTVQIPHEKDTIQSYFNYGRIERLFGPLFKTVEITLVRQENVLKNGYRSRYHCVFQKNN